MPTIRYSEHLKHRLTLRGIPYKLPKKIYKTAKQRYLDNVTGLLIAVKRTRYKAKLRDLALIYTENEDEALLITIHPLKHNQKIQRINSKRWQKIPKI